MSNKKTAITRFLDTGITDRRNFFKNGAALLTAIAATQADATPLSSGNFPHSMLNPGTQDEVYGMPSKYEKQIGRRVNAAKATSNMTSSYSPIQQLQGTITPSGLHFGIHHSGIPDIAPENHQLYIHGLTKKALKFSVEDLLRYPQTGGIYFVECSGNTWPQGRTLEAPDKTCNQLYGLLSCSEWIGVPVKILLQEAGLLDGASWVIAEGSDAGTLARSIPLEKMLDDALVALYQNGERLRPGQGYPMRLILPGFEGNTQVKWLRRLQVADKPAHTKDESRTYTETLPDGNIQRFSLVMDVKSVITHPSAGQRMQGKGFYEVSGIAWSGYGKINKVEVSDNGGQSWRTTELHEPVTNKSLTRFSLPWHWLGEDVRLMSRATDDKGNIQPTHQQWKSGYMHGSYNHYNAIQSWHINPQGEIKNVF